MTVPVPQPPAQPLGYPKNTQFNPVQASPTTNQLAMAPQVVAPRLAQPYSQQPYVVGNRSSSSAINP